MRQIITQLARSCGVTHWGVCSFGDLPPLLPCRAMSRLPEKPNSVIVFLFPYYTGPHPKRNVALYAVPDDYHKVAGGILKGIAEKLSRSFPEDAFAPFVDSSPIPEVEAARLAGLGVLGRNGQLITEDYGAYAFIGTIVTTLSISPDSPSLQGCLDCGACVSACPTRALSADLPFDKSRCRSHITQKKGALTPWESAQVQKGGLVWGCDICLEACPMNRDKPVTPLIKLKENPTAWVTPEQIGSLRKNKAYGFRPKAVMERNYRLIYQTQTEQQE